VGPEAPPSKFTGGNPMDACPPSRAAKLLSVARDKQLKLYELANLEPPFENLFDKAAIKSALPVVSKARYEQTLCAENPTLKPFLDKLESQKTQQTLESLSMLWKCTTEKASEKAELLVEVGFFERIASKDRLAYWVPFLYRAALNLVQGTA
jgi:hypothetical protein